MDLARQRDGDRGDVRVGDLAALVDGSETTRLVSQHGATSRPSELVDEIRHVQMECRAVPCPFRNFRE